MPPTVEQLKLAHIFCPYALKRQEEALANGQKFVHYTTADAALKILTSKEVWMRKSSAMNDFREVHHGIDCLSTAYRHDVVGTKFKAALNEAFPGLDDEVAKLFDGWMPNFIHDTYLTCVSEHDNIEDNIGRLSMWRSYGSSGVGLVMNNGAFLRPSDALRAYTSPVAYLDRDLFQNQFEEVAANIKTNMDFIRSRGRETVKNIIFNMFKMAVVCTKHPGFREEREWRVIFSPALYKSERLIKDIQIIGGIPQPIYKIPLKDVQEEEFYGAELNALLDRVIIGPTQYPVVVYEAFVDVLEKAGVDNPREKVVTSDIPLRRP